MTIANFPRDRQLLLREVDLPLILPQTVARNPQIAQDIAIAEAMAMGERSSMVRSSQGTRVCLVSAMIARRLRSDSAK